MKWVVGRGNPGREYARTRHNVGFLVVEALARRYGASWRRRLRWPVRTATVETDGLTLCLVEPLTFMNRSGAGVGPLVRQKGSKPEDVLVIYDDADLPLGSMRMRPFGGPGGHNGMRSLIEALGTDRFPRLRVGIGRSGTTLVEHVLEPFTAEEWERIEPVIEAAADAALCWAAEGVERAMNRFNRTGKAESHDEQV